MSQKSTLKSLSLACRVVMDMHALNNEGSESNRLMTRQVGIVVPEISNNENADDKTNGTTYNRHIVNAISGDMNKHIFSDAYRNIGLDLGLPMSEPSQALDPARMMGDERFSDWVEGKTEGQKSKPEVNEVIDKLLSCSLTDVCGILITGSGTSVKRKSAIEFGWTVGLPGITEVEEFIHARHAITRLTRTKATKNDSDETKQQAQSERERNTGQMIFNRPANSGVYAFVAHLDVAAIGFNDARQDYPQTVTDMQDESVNIDRNARLRAALLALAQTLLHPKGALTSTQLPHVVDVEGYVSISTSAAAAPLISPLNDNYVERASKTADLLNRLHAQTDAVQVAKFAGNEGLLTSLDGLLDIYEAGQYRRV